MPRARTVTTVLLAAVMALGLAAGAAPAGAATGPVVIASGLSSPAALAVGEDGSVYVSRLVPGALLEVSTGTAVEVAESSVPVTGVAAGPGASLAYVRSGGGTTTLETVSGAGRNRPLANLARHEARHNPDAGASYGLQDLDPECAADVPGSGMVPGRGRPYGGLVATGSAAVVALPDGTRVVADGRANDLVRVRPNGSMSTLAVLPPVPALVTASLAASLGLPGCAIGSTVHFEPNPTDVELGPDGLLYVSISPGGAGGASGQTGAVYSVDPDTGDVEWVAGGFRGATDLAVAADGTVYVAELFGGQISIANGTSPITFRLVERPSAVEYAEGALYAAVDFSFGPPTGKVVTYFLR